MADKKLVALDCVNGITYIGRENAGLTLDNWVLIGTREIPRLNAKGSYHVNALEYYRSVQKSNVFMGLSSATVIVSRHELSLPESS
ncbi:MAG: hypothetical protein AABX11_05550 [Nanoarchaeota archaeon]